MIGAQNAGLLELFFSFISDWEVIKVKVMCVTGVWIWQAAFITPGILGGHHGSGVRMPRLPDQARRNIILVLALSPGLLLVAFWIPALLCASCTSAFPTGGVPEDNLRSFLGACPMEGILGLVWRLAHMKQHRHIIQGPSA